MKENITERVHVRTTVSEKKKLERAVKRVYPYASLNAWARRVLLAEADRMLKEVKS